MADDRLTDEELADTERHVDGLPSTYVTHSIRVSIVRRLLAEVRAHREAQPQAGAEELRAALEMTGCKDVADLIDMANVGRSLMERVADLVKQDGPFKGWAPADDPAEIVIDLVNHYEDALQSAPPAREAQDELRGWKLMPREPTEAMQIAAMGPIRDGGRNGPITSDRLRANAMCSNYRAMWDAASTPPGAATDQAPMKMLVDQGWLSHRIETDPDLEVDAGVPHPKAPVSGGAASDQVREA